nr:DUF6193 family natural product biosynthesis protein [Streptomyces canus]
MIEPCPKPLTSPRPGANCGAHSRTRQGDPLVIEAAHAQPQLRALHPFPTHGTLHFLRSAPPWRKPGNLPLIACSGPPHKVYPSGYAALLGEGTTAEEAAALVVAHLPTGTAGAGG